MQPSRRFVQGSKAALALVLAAGLAAACASKPGARTAAGYKVGRTGAALSAAADDPRRLAALQQRIARPDAATVARRPAAEAQARRLAAEKAKTAGRSRAGSARASAAAHSASGASGPGATAPVPLGASSPGTGSAPIQLGMALTPNAAPAAAADLAPDPAKAAPGARGLALPQSVGGVPLLSLALLGGLALMGLMFLALLKRLMARKRSGADLDPGLPTAANDADGPSRPANRRSRSEPPPPTVTIRKAAQAG